MEEVKKAVELSDFQKRVLNGIVSERIAAQKSEQEFVEMIFKTKSLEVPTGEIKYENGSIIY